MASVVRADVAEEDGCRQALESLDPRTVNGLVLNVGIGAGTGIAMD